MLISPPEEPHGDPVLLKIQFTRRPDDRGRISSRPCPARIRSRQFSSSRKRQKAPGLLARVRRGNAGIRAGIARVLLRRAARIHHPPGSAWNYVSEALLEGAFEHPLWRDAFLWRHCQDGGQTAGI